MRRIALAGIVCAGLALGVVAEQEAYRWSDLRGWLPDLLAGWTLIGLGTALLAMRRSGTAAGLLLFAGFSWFAFNFETTGPHAVHWLAVRAAYLHRAPLYQLAVASAAGRPRTRLSAGGVTFAWAAAFLWPLWDDDASALVLVAVFMAITAAGVAGRPRSGRRDVALRGLWTAAILGAAIAADSLRSIAGGSGGVTDGTVLAYAAAVALSGGLLFAAVLLDAPASLAERVVALGHGGARLRDTLRELLGDPQLQLGFAVDSGSFVDDSGRPLGSPPPGHVTSSVTVAGQQVGIVVHDPTTLADDATRSAVLAAVGLAAERVRLRREVTRRADTAGASRRRLLLAEDEERRRLGRRLDRSVGAEVGHVNRLVREAAVASHGAEELTRALERAAAQLNRLQPELDAPVRGFRGVPSDGLLPALRRLVADVPVETELEAAEVTISHEVASALWFVCSESLANVVKHADAHSARVVLSESGGTVRLEVEDEGRGGANPDGSGLLGLADRVAALGGRLQVVSPPGRGTRIIAELAAGDDRA